jgi:S-adenosylmethionine:tRNA ribosyltransferase-isomerase
MSEIQEYDYHLPRELIAQQPLPQRADARLLVVRRREGSLDHVHVRDLPDLLNRGDALVLNDTRVIPARLLGRRTRTGGRWSGLFLAADEQGNWKVLAKTRGHLAAGETITLQDRDGRDRLRLVILAKMEGGVWAVRPEEGGFPLELLDQVGRVPLPPYIRNGQMVDADFQSYQTVFAEKPGAVAAPTAGLHFTPDLLRQLEAYGVVICRITLHVGLGTFRPITASRLSDHTMHAEWGQVTAATSERLRQARAAGGRIVAVGTTAVRTLETAAAGGSLQPWQGETKLFIRPPFEFHATDGLLTNFHLPKSTLLVLVRTIGGDDLIQRAYAEAIRESYRFYSYGDAMLIL